MMLTARRVYSALLTLYPADFRRRYGHELTLLFIDMHRAAGQGRLARLNLWLTVVLDLLSTAARERIKTMLKVKPATVISLILCLPLLFAITTAALNYEPPFVKEYLTEPDGYTPTMLARIIMIFMLLSVPVALVINFLPMFKKAGSEQREPFNPTRTHAIIGLSILLILLAIFSQQVLHELRPFVTPLGSAAFVGQGLFFLLLSALPVAVLFNRLPRFTKAGSEGALIFQPTSTNLIIGAAILLIILTLVAIFGLEMTACSIGVPNCD